MEDLENKLQSTSPNTVVQTFSKIIQNILAKYKDEVKDFPELKFLKEKSLNCDPLISEVSGRAVVKLVEDRVLSIEPIIADFLSATSSTKCHSSLINIMGDLLYLKWKQDNLRGSKYNLYSPQHPLITILVENPSSCNLVLNKIRGLHSRQNELPVNQLFRPVYLYGLHHPSISMNLFKYRLWTFLLSQKILEQTLFFDLLCWLQIETRDHVELTSELIDQALLAESSNESCLNVDLLVLWQVTVLYYLALNKLDMLPNVYCLKRVFQGKLRYFTTNCVLLIFSKIIDVCSPVYLKDVFQLCETVVLQSKADFHVIQTLRSSLLQWLASPCILIEDAYKIAESIFNKTCSMDNRPRNDDGSNNFPDIFHKEITSNNTLFGSVELCRLSGDLYSETRLSEWLDSLQGCPSSFIEEILHFLCGLLLVDDFSQEILSKSLALILNSAERNVSLTPKLLAIILYKLSNTRHARLSFELLSALPKLVVLRENIPKIMSTLQAVSRGSENLFNVGLKLIFDAWKIDSMCYPYLEGLLVDGGGFKKRWDRYVTKSYIIKQLCLEKPELYGEEMVAHLSKILNECKDDNGSLPSALAIDAVTVLCKAEIVNVVQTWAILAPMFRNDLRLPVVKSLCSLIREIPQLSYTESYMELHRDVMHQLWEYVETGDPEICEAALSSLTSFGLEQICVHLPEEYLDPSTPTKTTPTTQHLVPGKTWIDFLIKLRVSSASVNFITKMISIEIDGYLKYVYQTKGNKEPLNYGYLPSHSVLRGLGEFIKTWSNKWRGSIHDKLYVECLRILSTEFSKPLPPLDWCFLQELMHDPQTKKYCVDLSSHQVIISGTARRLMENYINAVTEKPIVSNFIG
nr:focadhesin [Leptinotarsa decemlineata]